MGRPSYVHGLHLTCIKVKRVNICCKCARTHSRPHCKLQYTYFCAIPSGAALRTCTSHMSGPGAHVGVSTPPAFPHLNISSALIAEDNLLLPSSMTQMILLPTHPLYVCLAFPNDENSIGDKPNSSILPFQIDLRTQAYMLLMSGMYGTLL